MSEHQWMPFPITGPYLCELGNHQVPRYGERSWERIEDGERSVMACAKCLEGQLGHHPSDLLGDVEPANPGQIVSPRTAEDRLATWLDEDDAREVRVDRRTRRAGTPDVMWKVTLIRWGGDPCQGFAATLGEAIDFALEGVL